MGDFYKRLGIDENATVDEIKAAYRALAIKLHPDTNPHGGEAAKKQFHDLNEAYEVWSAGPKLCTQTPSQPQCLKDPTRRSAYDALRNADLSGIYGARGGSDDEDELLRRARSFEETFGRAWREAYGTSHSRDHWRRRAKEQQQQGYWEEYRANLEAWEAEKREAMHVKARSQRQRERIVTARHERTARVLRSFWHTHSGLTWQDGAVLAVACAGLAAAVGMWPIGAKAVTAGGGAPEQQP